MTQPLIDSIFKIDLADLIEFGRSIGFDIKSVEYILNDCEIGFEYGQPITVIYPEYLDRVGILGSEHNQRLLQIILSSIFEDKPEVKELYILDR